MSTKQKTGLPPGSVVFTGQQKVEKPIIHLLQFNKDEIHHNIINNLSEVKPETLTKTNVTWYDIRGIHDTSVIESIGETFGIHPLILEDIANVFQRPKFEDYDNGSFIVLRALDFDQTTKKIITEHISIYFKDNVVVSFQEAQTDLFEAIRQRLLNNKGRIRQNGSDYLSYALVDAIIDHYFIVLETIETAIEKLEQKITVSQQDTHKTKIHKLKKELLILKKATVPLREAIDNFAKSESTLIKKHTHTYIRDLYDHTIQVIDTIEAQRNQLSNLQELFLTEVSFKMNKVIQVLTIISTIFIPLTFLVGVYGMNFDNMPELHYRYGYFTLLGIMVVIFILLLIYFRRKKWL